MFSNILPMPYPTARAIAPNINDSNPDNNLLNIENPIKNDFK